MTAMYFSMPFRPAFDGNGRTIPGAKAYFTLSGTNTPTPIYATAALAAQRSNPLIANGVGKFPTAFLDQDVTYRVRIYDGDAVVGVDDPIEEYDPYDGSEQGSAGPVGPQGPGVTLLPQMVDANPDDGDPVILTTSGGGTFIYRSGNYSSLVSADTLGGIYVPLSADPLGNLGACVRQFSGYISPKWFGVVADGSDETTKLQAALNMAALLCGRILLTAGVYGFTALTVPFDVDIECAGSGVKFKPLDNTSTALTFSGRNTVSGGFSFEPATQRTGGKFMAFSGGDVLIDKFKATKAFKVADITGSVSNVTLNEVYLNGNNNNGVSELILVNTVGAGCAIGNILADNDPALQPLACVRIRACADFTFYGKCNIIHCGKDLLIDPPSGSVVASVFGGSMFLDTASSGLTLDSSMGGSIVRIAFDKIEASSHSTNCVDIIATAGSIAGLYIGYLETHLGTTNGVNVAGANLSGAVIAVHKAGSMANGAAIQMGANAVGLEITRAEYGNVDGIGATNKYHFTLGTSSAVTIGSLKTTAAATADINGTSTGLVIVRSSGSVVVRNKGAAAIASGGTSTVVSHGLSVAPGPSDIILTLESNQGTTAPYVDTTSITSTQFTVRTASAAASTINFAWQARALGA